MLRNPERWSDRDARGGVVTDDPAVAEAAAEWFARRDAELTATQEVALQRWLAADPRHGAALARLDATWSTFGKASRAGRADELLHELATRALRRRRQRIGMAAASLLVLMAVVAVWDSPRHGAPEAPAVSPGTATILVPLQRTLPDGSVVILKNGALIAVAFTDALRRVELTQGQAMFQVATDRVRPFVVSASGVEVRAVGTAFSVQLGRKEVEILVTEGSVAVAQGVALVDGETQSLQNGSGNETGAGARDGQGQSGRQASARPALSDVRVNAGNRMVVDLAPTATLPPQVLPVAAAVLDEWLAWRHLRVEFSGTPLSEAVALLNREAAGRSGPRLIVDDAALGSMRVSGVFRIDNMDAFVLLLEAGFGVEAERTGSTVRLRPAAAGRAGSTIKK